MQAAYRCSGTRSVGADRRSQRARGHMRLQLFIFGQNCFQAILS